MTENTLCAEFDLRCKEYEAIKIFVDSFLNIYKQTSGRAIIRSFSSRIKDWRSFLDNVEEKGCSNNQIWEEINDILGIRIVCLFRSELDIIDEWVKRTFEVIDEKRYEWGPTRALLATDCGNTTSKARLFRKEGDEFR